jgi:hypothetical protein
MFDVTLDAAGVTSKAKVRSYPSGDRARQTGEPMFLSETLDGRTIPYIEHFQGAQLAFLDITYPRHIRGEGSVYLGRAGTD